jgi:hypothetical protein
LLAIGVTAIYLQESSHHDAITGIRH